MYLFFVNIAIILGLAILTPKPIYIKIGKKEIDAYLVVVIGYLTMLALLRSYKVGTDTPTYCRIFQLIAASDSIKEIADLNFEKGYILYCYILSRISSSPRILLVISNLFMFFSVEKFFSKYSKCSWLSTYMFFTMMLFDFFLSGLRQGVAIAILLYAYDALMEKKKIKFLFLVLLASQFHLSACVFLVVYPISLIRSNKKCLHIFSVVGIVGCIMGPALIHILLIVFPKYNYYLGHTALSSDGRLGVVLKMLLYFVLFLCGEIVPSQDTISEKTKLDHMNYRLTAILPVVGLIALNAAGITRFFRYFELFLCIYFPNAIIKKSKDDRLIFTICCIIGMLIYSSIIQIFRTPEWQQTYPYTFFWQ